VPRPGAATNFNRGAERVRHQAQEGRPLVEPGSAQRHHHRSILPAYRPPHFHARPATAGGSPFSSQGVHGRTTVTFSGGMRFLGTDFIFDVPVYGIPGAGSDVPVLEGSQSEAEDRPRPLQTRFEILPEAVGRTRSAGSGRIGGVAGTSSRID